MRRHDLDWLRVLLFGLLVLHHTAIGFTPFGEAVYGFANDRLGGPLLSLAIYWSHGWRLPCLFLVAGIGTWFATAREAGIAFLGRRMKRLLGPLAVGCLILNPATLAVLGADFAELAGRPLPPGWWLPVPPWMVMHLWFLGNLALYTLAFWPLYRLRARLGGARPARLIAGLALAVTAIAVALKPHAPAMVGEGHQLWWYAGFFASGYLIGANHGAVLDWARRRVWWAIGLGLALFATEVVLVETARTTSDALAEALASGGWAAEGLAPAYGLRGMAFATVEGLDAWAWCVAALGLAARFLNRDGPWLRALSPAVFPVYVLHFPVTLIGLGLLTLTPWPWGAEVALLAAATFALSGLGYLGTRCLRGWSWLLGGRAPTPLPV